MKDFINKSIEEFEEEYETLKKQLTAVYGTTFNIPDEQITKFLKQKLQEAIEYGEKKQLKDSKFIQEHIRLFGEDKFKQSVILALENKEEERSEMASTTERDLFEDIGYQQALEDAIKIIKQL